MSSSLPPFLIDDLIAEVLSLLKVKCIVRFRCVSKHWDTLISDSTFVNLHLKKSAKQNPHFLLLTNPKTSISMETEHGVIPYSVSSLIENPSFTFFIDSYYLMQYKDFSDVVGSCNGLICLMGGYTAPREYYQFWFQLWNPATRTTSPKFGFLRVDCPSYADDGHYIFNFGCDNSTGTYKVVASRYNKRELKSNVRILSFGDSLWRDIQTFPVDPMYLDSAYENCREVGVYFKSTINWLVIQNHFWYGGSNISNNIKDISVEQFAVVSLDLRTETYNQYLLPPDFNEVPPRAPIIGVLGDCLSFSYCHKETHLIIWQMKKFGVQDSWTQFLKISYHNLQIDYHYSSENIKYYFELVPLLLSKDGDTLVLKCNQEYREILYNWRNDRVERTKITARKAVYDDPTVNFVKFSANGYFESLVSVF